MDTLIIEKTAWEVDEQEYSNNLDLLISKLIVKLLEGNNDIAEEHITPVLEHLPGQVSEVIEKRWLGIIASLNDNNVEAKNYFDNALTLAEEKNLDQWFKRDILIDKRNLKVWNEEEAIFEEEYESIQNKIRSMTSHNFYPVLDKFFYKGVINFQEELFKRATSSERTSRIGGNLPNSLKNISKALIVALYHGSYSFIRIIREQLGKLLYNYGDLLNANELVYPALKLLVVENKVSKVRDILENSWEKLQNEVAYNSSAVTNFPVKYKNNVKKKVIKCALLERTGSYLPEEELDEMQEFLFECLDLNFSLSKKFDAKRGSLIALRKNISILDDNVVAEKVVDLLDGHGLVRKEVIKLLKKVEWKNVNEGLVEEFVDILFELKHEVLEEYDIYDIYADIRKEYPDIIKPREEEFLQEWYESSNNLSINWYFSGVEYPPALEEEEAFVNDLLEKIKEENRKPEITKGGFPLFHLVVSHIINNRLSSVVDDTFNVFKEVLLNGEQSLDNKYECIESINRITQSAETSKIKGLSRRINRVIQENKEEVLECKKADFLFDDYLEKLELKINELLIRVETPERLDESIIAQCIEYGTYSSIDVRMDSVRTIKAIIDSGIDSNMNELRQYLYSKTFDEWYKIRAQSINSLFKISTDNEKWRDISLNRMSELIDDVRPYVKSAVINAIEKIRDNISKEDNEYKILKRASRDPNFEISDQASEALQNIT